MQNFSNDFKGKDNYPADQSKKDSSEEFDLEFEKLLSSLPFDGANKEFSGSVIQRLKQPGSKKMMRAEKAFLILLFVVLIIATVLLYNALPYGTDSTNPHLTDKYIFDRFDKSLLFASAGLMLTALFMFLYRLRKWKKGINPHK